MLNTAVLVLNRNYQPVHVTNVKRAFSLLYMGIARAIDDQYRLYDFETWAGLSAREHEHIATIEKLIRVPRAQGGRTSWENVVCSCIPCNLHKGGRTPEQAGMKLLKRPTRPRWTPFFRTAQKRI